MISPSRVFFFVVAKLCRNFVSEFSNMKNRPYTPKVSSQIKLNNFLGVAYKLSLHFHVSSFTLDSVCRLLSKIVLLNLGRNFMSKSVFLFNVWKLWNKISA